MSAKVKARIRVRTFFFFTHSPFTFMSTPTQSFSPSEYLLFVVVEGLIVQTLGSSDREAGVYFRTNVSTCTRTHYSSGSRTKHTFHFRARLCKGLFHRDLSMCNIQPSLPPPPAIPPPLKICLTLGLLHTAKTFANSPAPLEGLSEMGPVIVTHRNT